MNKQPNSRMCFVCGMKNIAGVKVFFYEIEDGTILARFTGQDIHQGYPGRFHGGVLAGILDEMIGRVIRIEYGDDMWGVTAELTIRYRQPVPLGVELEATGRVIKDSRRMFEGEGRILLPDGTAAVTARGKYVKLPPSSLSEFDPEKEEWQIVPD
ncbi:MAG: PaaI family thioesterase [Chloroflexota bacterium]|nr:PaaI family thioesterase [Chloroflexota bacterium]